MGLTKSVLNRTFFFLSLFKELQDTGGVTLAGEFCYRGRVFTWVETQFVIEIPTAAICAWGNWVPFWIDCKPEYLVVYLKSKS